MKKLKRVKKERIHWKSYLKGFRDRKEIEDSKVKGALKDTFLFIFVWAGITAAMVGMLKVDRLEAAIIPSFILTWGILTWGIWSGNG